MKTIKRKRSNRIIEFTRMIPPSDFLIIQDTREQQPLFGKIQKGIVKTFNTRMVKGLRVLSAPVKIGDYTVKGFESQITCERKRESDLYAYIGKDRDRSSKKTGVTTIDKLNSMRDAKFASLMIESDPSWKDIYGFPMCPRVLPSHVIGFIASVKIRYGLDVFVHNDKATLRRYLIHHFLYTYKLLRDG